MGRQEGLDWEQILKGSGGFSLPSAFITIISFDFTTILFDFSIRALMMVLIRKNNEMSQTLISLKWQQLGQGFLGPINPPCSLGQFCKGVEVNRMCALCGFF